MSYRYLGNKTRLASWIAQTVQSHLDAGASIADPMCGTASVSRAFADAGYRVHASDELRFPVLHAKARLLFTRELSFAPVATSYEDAIDQLNSLPGKPGFFWNEYSADGSPRNGAKPRGYFTGANASRIDEIRATLVAWRASGLQDDAADLLLHDLVLAGNRAANIAGTYGYYRSTFGAASSAPIRLQATPMAPPGANHTVSQGKVEVVAGELDVDACYLDPPYTKRQYGGNYHIPETLAQEDFPEPAGEGGLRDWYPQYSDFCSKRRVRDAFRETFKRLEVPVIFLSYSEDGLIPSSELSDLLGEFGTVSMQRLAISRFRSNGGKEGPVHEHLYVVKKR